MFKYEENIKKCSTLAEMHLPVEGKEIRSFHQISKHKTGWYLSAWKNMKKENTPINPELVRYKADTYPYHGLFQTLLSTVVPSIKVKKEYMDTHKIRFCDDLFVNMISEFSLSFNGKEIFRSNMTSLKISERNKKEEKEIGNLSCLTNWTDKIDSCPISIRLPWPYTHDKSDYFPLQLCGEKDILEHTVDFRLDIKNFLLMEKEGEMIDLDTEVLDIQSNIESFPVPEMEGLYTSLTENECQHGACVGDPRNQKPDIYIKTESYIEKQDQCLGKKVFFKFDQEGKVPVNRIYWGSVNEKMSREQKNLIFVNRNGKSTVRKTSLKDNAGIIYDKKESYKTEKTYHLGKNYKTFEGISIWENNILETEDSRKFSPSILIDEGNMTIYLSEEEHKEDRYTVFVIVKKIVRYRFTSYPQNQEERLKKGATLTML
jgi:hypothetical protein